MKILNAQIDDLKQIMKIYALAREFMAAHGNPNQWGPTNWPPEELVARDIIKQKCYVCVSEDRIIGVFFYDFGEKIDPTYNHIEGKWIGDENYGVVHRLATDGTVRGTGTFCVKWALEQCRHLRIDTHTDNIVMQNMLMKNGFERCGIIYVEQDDYPRIAYEKMMI